MFSLPGIGTILNPLFLSKVLEFPQIQYQGIVGKVDETASDNLFLTSWKNTNLGPY